MFSGACLGMEEIGADTCPLVSIFGPGMRRPSWNKSQAIQQVISLKALLETSEDSGAGALRRILVSRTPAVSVFTSLVLLGLIGRNFFC